jgi:hypothetical protein
MDPQISFNQVVSRGCGNPGVRDLHALFDRNERLVIGKRGHTRGHGKYGDLWEACLSCT